MNDQTLEQILDSMHTVRILVIGDVMLDDYVTCDVRRISPEAPVPVALVGKEEQYLGGAANVANNIRALGAEVVLVGVVGADAEGEKVRQLCIQNKINDGGLVTVNGRPTTTKRRILSGSHQILRIDREDVSDIDRSTQYELEKDICRYIESCDAVVLSDYCKGLLTSDLIMFTKELAEKHGKKVFADTKKQHLPSYHGVFLIKPNRAEAELIAGEQIAHDQSNLEFVGKKISAMYQSNVVITLGGEGVAIFSKEKFTHIPTRALQVFDVSGAGDTVLAALATATAAGSNLEDAVEIANIAAGYVVSRVGTTVCHVQILRQEIGRLSGKYASG